MRRLFPVFTLCLAMAADTSDPVVERLRRDVQHLAGPELRGRGNGSEDLDKAAAYILEAHRRLGLKAEIQRVPFILRVERERQSATLQGGTDPRHLQWGRDIEALPGSGSGTFTARPLVFAGLGLRTATRDDLAGLDLKGKVALVALRLPDLPAFASLGGRERSLSNRAQALIQAGAVAVLGIADGELPHGLAPGPSWTTAPAPLLAAPSRIFQEALPDLGGRIKKLGEGPQSCDLPAALDLDLQLKPVDGHLPNVIALIPGRDPSLAKEYVVLGAHLDHLGVRRPRGREGDAAVPHFGADDNASGSALVLELARRFTEERPRRSMLVMHFGGEEMGLVGSRYWMGHPTVDLSQVKFMANFDMVGRVPRERPRLRLLAPGVSLPQLARLAALAPEGLTVVPDPAEFIYGGSDHQSFTGRGIPTSFFFTGLHKDYHRPTDTPEKLNLEGMSLLAGYAQRMLRQIADGTPPAFTPPVSLGLRGERQLERGHKVGSVERGSVADAAGLKPGDLITGLGDLIIHNATDFRQALGELQAGDRVLIRWLRDGKDMEAMVVLRAR